MNNILTLINRINEETEFNASFIFIGKSHYLSVHVIADDKTLSESEYKAEAYLDGFQATTSISPELMELQLSNLLEVHSHATS